MKRPSAAVVAVALLPSSATRERALPPAGRWAWVSTTPSTFPRRGSSGSGTSRLQPTARHTLARASATRRERTNSLHLQGGETEPEITPAVHRLLVPSLDDLNR